MRFFWELSSIRWEFVAVGVSKIGIENLIEKDGES